VKGKKEISFLKTSKTKIKDQPKISIIHSRDQEFSQQEKLKYRV
jgi:hypothetical protein